jgi:ribosome-binding protein aMBF1 (putative translation factor)
LATYVDAKYPGLRKEDCELFEDLEKWSLESLTQKFLERVQQHLKANSLAREDLAAKIREMAAKHRKKQNDNYRNITGRNRE